ncbi:MAG TPA: DUF1801 domain-containing protein [Cryomorphaceae bacterium]|nr:hypothetical protein [Owenweeksia sp.]MBF98065.1 hypothetical protein [Owenweeksia sp.]HAD97245.1 DUF1801 domain-containing protein [Cryomorphaceae bacterium]HBF21270.1 DUF1801 domain-containing protein [Cryomorphaceae bacterium]HCQ15487.1 DUF1801 domain-containing protein [Cryomorphaceae bacterium]
MAELKTKPNDEDPRAFLEALEDENKRKDALALLEMMQEISGCAPKMWGSAIIGFGSYHYQYESGREGDWFIAGFSPRKQNLALYIMSGFDRYNELLQKLGKHKTGKSCLYIKHLSEVNPEVLYKLVETSYRRMEEKYKS